jgi:hypothetical protein
MLHAIFVGLLVTGPATPPVAAQPDAPVVLAEDGPNDILMNPSRLTEGAARLGGTEIQNPPYESFGMMQKPTNPSTMDLRQVPTGAPVVSGAQAKANAAEVRDLRNVAAQEAGLNVRNPVPVVTPQQAAADAANAQAAGVQAAVSSAKTSAAAAEEPPANQPATPSTAPPTPDRDRGEPDQGEPPDASPPAAPDTGP